jgi:hypothetical protein
MVFERLTVALGIELLGASAYELADGLQLEEEAGLGFGVDPVGVVEHADPGANGGEQFDLDLVFPPAAAEREPVAAVEVGGLVVELLEPVPSLLGLAQATPAGDRDVGGHQHVRVRARGGETLGGHAACLSLRSLKYKRRRSTAGRRLP